ncbi:PAS domain S-box protein [Desulfogranum marinum]|uniref:PAS domain S-box protein n=1 Tax=Desulfogranum marinum TaxID=453220 RepID=UPI001965FEFE|nr:PAS domain S-box protein [Desulfogranum marinum]MBM9512343.1 PAS domain S-box protein [Desulfogranum marinum]
MHNITQRIQLLEQRCRLLRSICEFKVGHASDQEEPFILKQRGTRLLNDQEYCFIWAAKRGNGTNPVEPLFAAGSTSLSSEKSLALVSRFLEDNPEDNPVVQALEKGEPIRANKITPHTGQQPLDTIIKATGTQSYISWPLISNNHEYGVLTIHSTNPDGFTGSELDFIANVMADISLALYVDETAKRLRKERDFNAEIVDTVQALLISLSPCGNILSFNQKAQEVTGFSEHEVKGKYWVDVLISPELRIKSQKEFSGLLQQNGSDINFQTELETRNGERCTISWHGSFQPNIEQGTVGLVLFGIDVTSEMAAERERENALAQWNNIFSAMQDPALVVSEDGVILDINPATEFAAKRKRKDIVGKGVCEILHGGRSPGAICPLEAILLDKKNRVFETELRGLQGNYMMTISPLKEFAGKTGVALLLARDLTEEQLMKAEALRSAQLASVGELAAGVAHEINNPINGIINYAQILKDSSLQEEEAKRFLDRIIKEGKRIAGITKNLLDFSRKREEEPEPVNVINLIKHCIELVQHQFTIDGITIEQQHPNDLPNIICNPQQIQQVFLNIFSNARYALNQRQAKGDQKAKLLQIHTHATRIDGKNYVELAITDNGTGIEHEIIDRVMDPFFSTKTSGEGTGLGLSISHSLVQDNHGLFRIHSELGNYTTLLIDLPTIDQRGQSHVG